MIKKRIKKSKILSGLFLAVVLLFLYLPILWLIVFSFTDTTSFSNWNGFSFNAYKELFVGEHAGRIFEALLNTLIIAFSAAALSTVLGTTGALGLSAMRRKFVKKTYKSVSNIPIANAEIVTAISLMLLFALAKTFLKLPNEINIVSVIFAHTAFCTPFVMLNVMPRLHMVDNSLYEAALDLGAKPSQAIAKVVLPDILPGIIMGFVLALTLSIDDFVISNYTVIEFETLSTLIYSMANGKKPLPIEIRALSSIIFLVLLALLSVVNFKSSKAKVKAATTLKGGKK